MGKYGVKVSQQGIDISRAADYQKVLDSDWKFLDIYDEIDVDITFDFSTQPTGFYLLPLYIHSLNYVAGFEFFPSTQSKTTAGFMTMDKNTILQYLRGDKRGIYFLINPSLTAGRLVGKLRVFTINILEEYTAPTVYKFTTAVQPPGRYGAKFIDKHQGVGNIDSEDMEPFTLNTRGKQISIHKHGLVMANGTVVVKHDIGYPPSYLICKVDSAAEWSSFYARPNYDSDLVAGPLLSSFYLAQQLDKDTLSFRGVQVTLSGYYAFVILKDPMEIAG